MTTDNKRLSSSDLVEQLSELEERLADARSKGRLKALLQDLRTHQVELEMQNRELREAHQALVVGFFGLVNNLSERQWADKALADERTFVSAVLDTTGALVVVLDRDGRIVRFNRESERATGYSATEVEGRRFDMFLLPGERIDVEDVFGHLSDGDFPLTYENHWVAKSGGARLIAWSNTALTGPDGRVEHVIATGIDVTERRRMEEELRESERQLKLITDAVPVLISYVDCDLRYRFANAAYGEWLGVEPSQMIGQRLDDLIEEDTMAVLRPFAARALAGEEVSYENVLNHRRLGRRDVSMNLVPDRDQHGVVHGYFAVALDITDRKRREAADKRRLLESAHADRLSTMGGMTTEIAHELNQPLTAIATTADICVRRAAGIDGGGDDMLSESLSEISTQAHRAARIIKHLRDFARRHEPEYAPVAVERVIDRALSLIRIEADANHVAVRAVHHSRAMVEADVVLIEQVIVNLARNAIQAMSAAGTDRPRLMLATEATREHIELAVFDNGPGLADAVLAHLFEPFHTTSTEGMGLGLPICRTIVEAHGGEIRGENRPAGGAVFRIRLRRLDDSKQDWSGEHDC
ncbi:MAG: PAS domain S-box protein [Gammaproteobacteria bacterium]|nr:PAS domain S-box protein [Gammaproteobacteria bacterium]